MDVPGHVLEFGSFNGTNLVFMAKLLQILSPHNLKLVYGFDSFEGLTQLSPEDKLPDSEVANYKGDQSLLKSVIDLYGLDEIIHLEIGYIEETLPKFLDENRHHLYSLIYIDTDLYSSTKIVRNYSAINWHGLSVGFSVGGYW